MSKKKNAAKSKAADRRKSLFDHVKHIKQVQDPNYYNNLSEDDRKTFSHFMILRALSMDEDLVELMASLYQFFDKIPSPQFYTLLIALVPKSYKFCPWIKTRKFKHSKGLLEVVGARMKVPKYQANDYVNILLGTEEGQQELVNICQAMGLDEKEMNELFEAKDTE